MKRDVLRWRVPILSFGFTAIFIEILMALRWPEFWKLINTEDTPMTWWQSILLWSCGLLALGSALLARQGGKPRRALAWGLFGAAFLYLAFDEKMMIHETLRDKVFAPRHWRLPLFSWTAPGDFVLIAYALLALALAPQLLRLFKPHKGALAWMFAGAAVACVAIGIDSLDFHRLGRLALAHEQCLEEILESTAMLCFFNGLFSAHLDLLQGLRPPSAG